MRMIGDAWLWGTSFTTTVRSSEDYIELALILLPKLRVEHNKLVVLVGKYGRFFSCSNVTTCDCVTTCGAIELAGTSRAHNGAFAHQFHHLFH
jgi:hypothetical protein